MRAAGNGVGGRYRGGGVGPGCTRPAPSRVGGSARATAAPGGDQAWLCAVCPAPRSEGPRRLPGRRAGGAGRGRGGGGGHPGVQVPVAWLGLKHRAVRGRARGSRAAVKGGGAAGRGAGRPPRAPSQPPTGGQAPAAAPWALLEEVGAPLPGIEVWWPERGAGRRARGGDGPGGARATQPRRRRRTCKP